MGTMNIYNTSGANKASLTFTGSSDVTVDSNNLSGLTSNVQTQLGQMIGVGQTWQDVTSSRSAGVTYTNTTGKPIVICTRSQYSSISGDPYFTVNGSILLYGSAFGSASTLRNVMSYIIPNGSTYNLTEPKGLSNWFELR